ncbi:Uncharacterised protein [Raoultella ornithinolytica]|nr:Uncharacterised protein [Raoultella ornithinolytica]
MSLSGCTRPSGRREADLREAIVTEYGAPASRSQWMAAWPAQTIKQAMETLASFEFVEPGGACAGCDDAGRRGGVDYAVEQRCWFYL